MALVISRGAVHGEVAGDVAGEAIIALVIFIGIGWVAGWIADYLVRDAVEHAFRRRVDWYRESVMKTNSVENHSTKE